MDGQIGYRKLSQIALSPTLPTETFMEIAENLSQSDLASLARVSKFFKNLSTPLLYRNVSLSGPFKAVQCCMTLIDAHLISKIVQSFDVVWWDISTLLLVRQILTPVSPSRNLSPNLPLASFCKFTHGALLQLSSLTSLSLRLQHLVANDFFDGLNFFNLQIVHLELVMEPTESLYTFLRRHRLTLTHIHIDILFNPLAVVSQPAMPLGPFPNLVVYMEAGVQIMGLVLPGSRVSTIGLGFCRGRKIYPNQQLRCLDDLPITMIHTLCRIQDIPELRRIMCHARGVTHLHHCFLDTDMVSIESVMTASSFNIDQIHWNILILYTLGISQLISLDWEVSKSERPQIFSLPKLYTAWLGSNTRKRKFVLPRYVPSKSQNVSIPWWVYQYCFLVVGKILMWLK